MKLYLYNQTRNRDIEEYFDKLQISATDFNAINTPDTQILLVGGGMSPIQPNFSKTNFVITNIDFAPSNVHNNKLNQIKGDFLVVSCQQNFFNEIWALYSLPLYAKSVEAIRVFFAKSILALAPKGTLRIFPLEFSDDTKLKTRDAEWEITTKTVTETVVSILTDLKTYGISTRYIKCGKQDEYAAVIKIPDEKIKKNILDNRMTQIIQQFANHNLTPQKIYE